MTSSAPRPSWGYLVLAIGLGIVALGLAFGMASTLVWVTQRPQPQDLLGGSMHGFVEASRTMRLLGFVSTCCTIVGWLLATIGCAGLVAGRPRWVVVLVGAAGGVVVRIADLAAHAALTDALGRYASALLLVPCYALVGIGLALARELAGFARVAAIVLAALPVLMFVVRLATRATSPMIGVVYEAALAGLLVAIAIAAMRARSEAA